MTAPTPRLRMFAGPNGSGKSTLKSVLPEGLLGLYYIATDDPEINISRVRYRVEKQGGHAVPEHKITSRYHRSLGLLWKAISYTNRAYIFDNSTQGQERTWLAEITNGRNLELKSNQIPAWFRRAVLDKAECKH